MVAGYCFVQMTENRQDVSSATELAYWRLIDAYDYTYVAFNGARQSTPVFCTAAGEPAEGLAQGTGFSLRP